MQLTDDLGCSRYSEPKADALRLRQAPSGRLGRSDSLPPPALSFRGSTKKNETHNDSTWEEIAAAAAAEMSWIQV